MRILVASDLHIDQGRHSRRDNASGLPTAWLSAARCWEAACDAALERSADLVVVTGDVFRNGNPSPEATEIVADGLRRLASGGVKALLIPGNHEDIGRPARYRHALEHMADIPGVTVESAAAVTDLADGLAIGVMPWPSARWLLPESRADNQAEMLEMVSRAAQTKLDDLAEAFGERAGVLFGHLAVAEAAVGGRRGSEIQMISTGNEPLVGVAELEDDRPWKAVVLGHIHRRQKLGSMTHYVGSLDAHDFGDEGSNKAVSLLDISGSGETSVTTIGVPYRKLRTVSLGNDDSPEDVVAEEGEIVRLRVADPKQADEARSALIGLGALVSEVRVTPTQNDRSREAAHISENDPSQWLDAYVAQADIPEALLGRFRSEAAARMESAVSSR